MGRVAATAVSTASDFGRSIHAIPTTTNSTTSAATPRRSHGRCARTARGLGEIGRLVVPGLAKGGVAGAGVAMGVGGGAVGAVAREPSTPDSVGVLSVIMVFTPAS
jgi:hypothetical protein